MFCSALCSVEEETGGFRSHPVASCSPLLAQLTLFFPYNHGDFDDTDDNYDGGNDDDNDDMVWLLMIMMVILMATMASCSPLLAQLTLFFPHHHPDADYDDEYDDENDDDNNDDMV